MFELPRRVSVVSWNRRTKRQTRFGRLFYVCIFVFCFFFVQIFFPLSRYSTRSSVCGARASLCGRAYTRRCSTSSRPEAAAAAHQRQRRWQWRWRRFSSPLSSSLGRRPFLSLCNAPTLALTRHTIHIYIHIYVYLSR